jgi:hypothetical protein
MTTACPCFGRNENCRLSNGTGLITAEVEAKVARSRVSKASKDYSVITDALGTTFTTVRREAKPRLSATEKKANFVAAKAAEARREAEAVEAKERAAKCEAERLVIIEAARTADELIRAGWHTEMLKC